MNSDVSTLEEQKNENFMNFLGDLEEDVTSEESEGNESSSIGEESV